MLKASFIENDDELRIHGLGLVIFNAACSLCVHAVKAK
jgi:hypothetical protein